MNFFKYLWTRYHPNYVRALIYMLQANEYYPFEYMAWYHRTNDFYNIEERKHLVYTLKAILLSAFAWISLVWSFASSAIFIYWSQVPGIVAAIAGFILAPFIVPYTLFLLIVFLNALQKPVEAVIVSRAKAKLKRHKAIKIAVAGSFGKTTMREILKTVLSQGKRVAAPGGSHNTPLAIARFVKTLAGDEEVLVFEFGEYYPGDIKKLCNFVEPNWGVITGVNEAHLERFGSLEKAAKTIYELVDYLKAKSGSFSKGSLQQEILGYVNAEGTYQPPRDPSSFVYYDKRGTPSWEVTTVESSVNGLIIGFAYNGEHYQMRSRLLGVHNVGPIAAAADIASRLGLSPEQIGMGVGQTKPYEHRMQPNLDGGVTWIDDSYNGNPDGAAAAIAFLKSLEGSRRWYVTPGLVEMGSRKEEIHREMGKKLAEAKIEKVVLIKNSVTPYIEEGLKAAGYAGEILWYDFGPTAFNALPKMTVAGDVVLLQNDWPDQYE
jgi:UDP-N-acetylmuramoyl-tripeptide--D-alanyl-D-alanine ligase